ncbi:MAG TPA: tetratricopeptide repeat protein, partial [Hyphomicrobiales bacterium]
MIACAIRSTITRQNRRGNIQTWRDICASAVVERLLRIPARASIFIALTAAALGAEPWDEAIARANLLTGQAKYTEAEGALKEALEEAGGAEAKDPRAAAVLNNLGALYRDMGRYPAAERFYLRAIDLLEAIQPNYAAELTKTHGNLAALYVESRQFRKAE